jgi:hypothetical protein
LLIAASIDWQLMIMRELLGSKQTISEWQEGQTEGVGGERKRRSEKQNTPEARQKRARKDRSVATEASERRKQNQGKM